jgi:hypothetical protein
MMRGRGKYSASQQRIDIRNYFAFADLCIEVQGQDRNGSGFLTRPIFAQ